MSLFGSIVNDATRAYCAANHLPEPPTYGDAHYCQPEDTSAADTAREWISRCRESEDAALDVMSEIEITCHGNFVQKAMHLLADIGPYTDRDRIVNDLQDALLDTLKKCAANE